MEISLIMTGVLSEEIRSKISQNVELPPILALTRQALQNVKCVLARLGQVAYLLQLRIGNRSLTALSSVNRLCNELPLKPKRETDERILVFNLLAALSSFALFFSLSEESTFS